MPLLPSCIVPFKGLSYKLARFFPFRHFLYLRYIPPGILTLYQGHYELQLLQLVQGERITDTISPCLNAKQAKRIIHCCYRHHRSALDKGIREIILSRLANYFRYFSDKYIAIHGEDLLNDNNWYEFVKHGTMDKTKMVPEKNWLSLGIGKLYTEKSK